MKRIGMTLAVVVGTVLLTVAEARACEGHSTKAHEPSAAVAPGAQEKAEADKAGELHAAKCQCGSAADCTCKKGTCQCPKCKRRGQDMAPSPEAEGPAPELRQARDDAPASAFI